MVSKTNRVYNTTNNKSSILLSMKSKKLKNTKILKHEPIVNIPKRRASTSKQNDSMPEKNIGSISANSVKSAPAKSIKNSWIEAIKEDKKKPLEETVTPTKEKKISSGKKKLSEKKNLGEKKISTEKKVNKITIPTNPPKDWEKVYKLIQEMRKPGGIASNTPVDTMGCEILYEDKQTPNIKRFQTLISLMLSSQTRDEMTSRAVHNQRKLPGGFTPLSLMTNSLQDIHDCIRCVGFHNTKVNSIRDAASICHSKYNDDIPSNLDELLQIRGVGPKMAYLCLQCAWDKNIGIGIDVHVHRITNRLGWHITKTPEQTRVCLESWLPKDLWKPINPLLVGFGQTICGSPIPKCHICLLSKDSLCPSSNISKYTRRRAVSITED